MATQLQYRATVAIERKFRLKLQVKAGEACKCKLACYMFVIGRPVCTTRGLECRQSSSASSEKERHNWSTKRVRGCMHGHQRVFPPSCCNVIASKRCCCCRWITRERRIHVVRLARLEMMLVRKSSMLFRVYSIQGRHHSQV